MSIPITIFIPKDAPEWSPSDLNAKLASHGFQVVVNDFDPSTHVGFLPTSYDGQPSGFEYYHEPIEEYLESVDEMREEEPDEFPYTEEDLRRVAGSRAVVQLITHSSYRQRAAAIIVASCLGELCGGWVLDEPVWKWHDAASAVTWARGAVAELWELAAKYGE